PARPRWSRGGGSARPGAGWAAGARTTGEGARGGSCADLPVAKVDLARCGRGDIRVVRDKHDRPAGRVQLVEQGHDVGPGVAVEVPRRLVSKDDRGLGDERT